LLFMEGTMMQRSNSEFPAEQDVEEKIVETIRDQDNITFILASSQNIDRLVSAYRACKRTNKTLVIDIYTSWILEQLKLASSSVPAMEWDSVKVYATYSHDKRIKEHPGAFGDFRQRLYKHRVHMKELQANPAGYLFYAKTSSFWMIEKFKLKTPANVIYSQWLGYLTGNSVTHFGAREVSAYRNDPQVNFVYAHTSGHATIEDLQKFASALDPKMLVPVHTHEQSCFMDTFDNVVLLQDETTLSL
jgi:ribonuclease J